MIPEITVRQLAEKLNSPNPPLLIDVREPHEHVYCAIPGAQLKPMGQTPVWMKDLDPHAEIVLLCHSGMRSLQVAMYLQRNGFTNVANLRGGIDAWAVEVDPSVPRY